jgi:hypothetical protein
MTSKPSPAAPASAPSPARIFRLTLLAALLPGAGHALLRRPVAAALLFAGILGTVGLCAWHLLRGLAFFESPLGVFLFAALLRGAIAAQAFAVLDAYLRANRSEPEAERRRLAVLANLLVPGAGSLLLRSWLRALTGLALLSLVVIFARLGRHPYIDVIYVGLQLLSSAAVLAPQRVDGDGPRLSPARSRPLQAPAGQIVILVAIVAAVVGFGIVTLRMLPSGALSGLSTRDVQARHSEAGIVFSIPRLGVKLTADGPGWKVPDRRSEFILAAEHADGGNLMLGIQKIYPFERPGRVSDRLRLWLEAKGLVLRRSLELKVGGAPATQLRFSGDFGDHRIDHWAIAIPRDGFAFVLMLQCERKRCDTLAPVLERTRDSFSFVGSPR